VYGFTICERFKTWVFGTIGFWRAWSNHNTFTQAEIETWLAAINGASAWFGPATTAGMTSMMNAALGGGAAARQKFLAHCLATQLDARSGILDLADAHDVRGKDPANYLALATPASATLAQIFAAIETKYGTTLTNARYNIMKDVCDALNNHQI
jgi:hypothetical protein